MVNGNMGEGNPKIEDPPPQSGEGVHLPPGIPEVRVQKYKIQGRPALAENRAIY